METSNRRDIWVAVGATTAMAANLREFGVRVRTSRLHRAMSVRELAKRVGVSHASMSILEIGRNPKTKQPSQNARCRLARKCLT